MDKISYFKFSMNACVLGVSSLDRPVIAVLNIAQQIMYSIIG